MGLHLMTGGVQHGNGAMEGRIPRPAEAKWEPDGGYDGKEGTAAVTMVGPVAGNSLVVWRHGAASGD